MKLDKRKYRDKIRGSMMGGAVGDALGYPVEFLSYKEILKQYPPKGIQAYELNFNTRTALISDDTQMALYGSRYFTWRYGRRLYRSGSDVCVEGLPGVADNTEL